jgi:hypothetical protein
MTQLYTGFYVKKVTITTMNDGSDDGFIRSTYFKSLIPLQPNGTPANVISDMISRDTSTSVLDSYFTGGNLASTRHFSNKY